MLDTIARRFVPTNEKASLDSQKAVTGPGATVMTWGTPISDLQRGAHDMMKSAQTVYARGNRWVKRAEMTISGRVGSVGWHLETPDGETITDDSPPELRAYRDLFEKPLGDDITANQYAGQPRTRRESWGLTSRHMGLCNVGFWYLDEIDRAAMWPKRVFFVRPDRMTPKEQSGKLTNWILDKDMANETTLSLEEVLPFYLDPPDRGYFGTGLVESIYSTVALPNTIDRHAMDTLDSGGRLPGMYSPKEVGASDPVFDRITSDLRTIKDMEGSAKRDIVARIPLDFTPTAADMNSLVVTTLAQTSRDDTLAHWGVPLSTIGGYTPAGMNSGETRKYDEAALWQNAVQFRIDALYETIQYQLLDRLKSIGVELNLVIEVPEFDDKAPQYELAAQAMSQPLRNVERRAILGLDPFGDPALDNAVWVPVSVVELALAPAIAGTPEPPVDEEPELSRRDTEAVGDLIRAGFDPADALAKLGLPDIEHIGLPPVTVQPGIQFIKTEDQKASAIAMPSLEPIRERAESALERDVRKVLDRMRDEISRRVADKHDHLERKPGDSHVWWNETKWKGELEKAIKPHLAQAASTAVDRVEQTLGKRDD